MYKSTPGPWTIRNWTEVFCGRKRVCHVNAASKEPLNMMQDRQVAEANARLIAASPDLYAVLKELQESAVYWSEYDVPLGIVDRINQAIAKAEGNA